MSRGGGGGGGQGEGEGGRGGGDRGIGRGKGRRQERRGGQTSGRSHCARTSLLLRSSFSTPAGR